MPVTLRTLTIADFDLLHEAFIGAFADYHPPLQPEKTDFYKRLNRINVDFALSMGAFEGERMVGFIIHATGAFHELPTVYNGGTGVLPDFRRQGLIKRMYAHILPLIKEKQVRQSVLEVITENHKAFSLYQEVGFRMSRTLNCYTLPAGKRAGRDSTRSEIKIVDMPQWEIYDNFKTWQPSWQNSNEAVMRNLTNEIVFEAHVRSGCAGFLIIEARSGRVSQFAVAENFRRRGMGRQLFRAAQTSLGDKPLTIINVDENDLPSNRFLEKIGFVPSVKQFEMVLDLDQIL